jgi:serine/threonine protein kinase
VVLFEMLFGYCPFESSSISQLINVIKDTELKLPKDVNPVSEQTETIIRKMLVKDQFKRIEWVDLFDFKIDEKGQILSGYKKDLGIEALEKYFLLDVKNVAEIEVGRPRDEDRNAKLKEDVESDKLIFSNKELHKEADKEPILKRIVSEQPSQAPPLPPPPSPSALSQPPAIDMREDFKDAEGESFPSRHKRWLKGIQLLDELSDCSDAQAETIFYYIILAILRDINEQTNSYSEWTDLLLEERRCLTDTLRSMGKD